MVKSNVSSDITDVTKSSVRKCLHVMTERNSDSTKYKGVRKRKWGKWVSEIRLPNSRERIWLGSFDSAVKAARAFDAALYCLRGPDAKFNFPDNPPDIPGGRTLAPSQIQAAAARFANAESRVGELDHFTPCSSGSDEAERVDSPSRSYSVSDGATHGPTHSSSGMGMDMSFLDQVEMMGSTWDNNNNNIGNNINNNSSIPDFGIFPGFDDFTNEFFLPPPLADDYREVEEICDDYTSQGSYLWNF